jgi:hypothetical protein
VAALDPLLGPAEGREVGLPAAFAATAAAAPQGRSTKGTQPFQEFILE